MKFMRDVFPYFLAVVVGLIICLVILIDAVDGNIPIPYRVFEVILIICTPPLLLARAINIFSMFILVPLYFVFLVFLFKKLIGYIKKLRNI